VRSPFEAGGPEKEAGPLGKRPGLGQRLDAGSRGKGSGPASDSQVQWTLWGEKAQGLQGGSRVTNQNLRIHIH